MGQIKYPWTNSNIYCQLIFDKEVESTNYSKDNVFNNIFKSLPAGYPTGKTG